jgi:pimeloyl-ACP methyl ester carboxylesterase
MDLEQWRMRARPLDFRGHEVLAYDGGIPDGEPLLLIHGFPTAAWDWHRVWEALGHRYRLVAPDLIGFGFSAKPADFPYSFPAQADLCESLLAERGIRDFHVLAHDYGDTVAQELLARRIERGPAHGMRSLCLLNGGVFPECHRPRPIQRALAGPLGPLLVRLVGKKQALASLARVFAPQNRPGEAEREVFWTLIDANKGRRIMPRLLRYIRERERNRDRWVSALLESPVPLIFIDGMLDPVSGTHMVERWRQLLPDAALVTLPGVGHYPQLEDPDAVLEASLPFFASAGFC